MLNRDTILAKTQLPTERVSVPEWGGDVFVRMLTGGERDYFESSINDARASGNTNIRARLASMTVCDESGKRLFSDSDMPAIAQLSAAALDRVFEVSARLNRLRKEDIDELEGN